MKSYFENYEFYKEMREEDKHILDYSISVREIEAGHVMRDGETECGEVPFVLTGSLRLFKVSESGREINIYHVKGGNMCSLSTLCLLGRISYAFNVEATMDSKLAFIPSHSFTVLIDRSEPFRRYVYAAIGQKLIATLDSFEALKFSSIEERIMKYLDNNKSKNNKVYITHQELAVELGSSREVISRELRKLTKAEKIRSIRGMIELL